MAYTDIYIRVHVHVHMHMHVQMHIHVHVHVHTYVYNIPSTGRDASLSRAYPFASISVTAPS
jgi:hypothetical protein